MSDAAISLRHAAALAYARQGIPVFPCIVNGKSPATIHGFKDRTTDEITINKWWGAADYNLGLVPEDAGWCAVDIDPKNGGDCTWETYSNTRNIPPTRSIKTPSGGWHFYFYGSLPSSAGKLSAGIDTRGRSSYVLVPPSIIDGKPYAEPVEREIAELPAWIAEAVESKAEPREAVSSEQDTPIAIAEARRWLALQPAATEGNASDTLYRHAAWLKDLGVSQTTAIDLLSEHNPSYTDDDIAVRVGNAWKHGTNKAGSHTPEADEAVFAGVEPPEPIETIARPASWWREREFAPVRWVWDKLLLECKANLLTGKSKVGKTTFLLNLAVHVLAGRPFLGAATRQGPVAMFLAEDGYGSVRDSLLEICDALKVDPAVLEGLHLRSTLDEPIEDGGFLARVEDNGAVRVGRFYTEGLVPWLEKFSAPPLVILDPITEFISFNRYADMSARKMVTGFVNQLCRVGPGVTALLTDHPSIAGAREGRDVGGSVQMEASFPLVGTLKAGEWRGTMTRQRKMTLEMKFNRYAPEARPITFYRVEGSHAYQRDGAPGNTAQDRQEAVYRHVLERLDGGEFSQPSNREGNYGPSEMAHALALEEVEIKAAISVLRARRWLEYHDAEGTGAKRVKGHFSRGGSGPNLASFDVDEQQAGPDPF